MGGIGVGQLGPVNLEQWEVFRDLPVKLNTGRASAPTVPAIALVGPNRNQANQKELVEQIAQSKKMLVEEVEHVAKKLVLVPAQGDLQPLLLALVLKKVAQELNQEVLLLEVLNQAGF